MGGGGEHKIIRQHNLFVAMHTTTCNITYAELYIMIGFTCSFYIYISDIQIKACLNQLIKSIGLLLTSKRV